MRKGADVLSKWVGEAERQLRILFEEAKASQPSIIFFDEIDGRSFLFFVAIYYLHVTFQGSLRFVVPDKIKFMQASSRLFWH